MGAHVLTSIFALATPYWGGVRRLSLGIHKVSRFGICDAFASRCSLSDAFASPHVWVFLRHGQLDHHAVLDGHKTRSAARRTWWHRFGRAFCHTVFQAAVSASAVGGTYMRPATCICAASESARWP